jgi:hypothetical protein
VAKSAGQSDVLLILLNVLGRFLCRIFVVLGVLQFSLGLMPELIVPSIRPVILFPNFLGTLSNLIF